MKMARTENALFSQSVATIHKGNYSSPEFGSDFSLKFKGRTKHLKKVHFGVHQMAAFLTLHIAAHRK